MKRSNSSLAAAIIILLLLQTIFAVDPANTIKYNGKDYYVNGINLNSSVRDKIFTDHTS